MRTRCVPLLSRAFTNCASATGWPTLTPKAVSVSSDRAIWRMSQPARTCPSGGARPRAANSWRAWTIGTRLISCPMKPPMNCWCSPTSIADTADACTSRWPNTTSLESACATRPSRAPGRTRTLGPPCSPSGAPAIAWRPSPGRRPAASCRSANAALRPWRAITSWAGKSASAAPLRSLLRQGPPCQERQSRQKPARRDFVAYAGSWGFARADGSHGRPS